MPLVAHLCWFFSVPDLEVVVLQGLLGRYPTLGCHLQQTSQQIEELVRRPRNSCSQANSLELWHFKGQLRGQLVPLGPFRPRWCPQKLQDLDQHVLLGRPWEEGHSSVEFGHDGSKGEDVHGPVVVGRSQQTFRGTVPPGGHVLGEGRLGPDLPGKPEVGELDSAVELKHVLGLQVAVEVALAVDVGQSLKSLVHDVAHFEGRQFPPLLQQLVDIALQVLEHKVELVVAFDELDQTDDVGVVQSAEDAHLVEADALLPLLVVLLHVLDGHHPSRALVDALHHAAESTVPQLATQAILLHSKLQYRL